MHCQLQVHPPLVWVIVMWSLQHHKVHQNVDPHEIKKYSINPSFPLLAAEGVFLNYFIIGFVIVYLFFVLRSSTKSAQAGDSTDTSTNSVPMEDSSCSSTSSASSVQTRVKVSEKVPAASDGTDSATGDAAGSPRHLLELRVSLSSPNLLHSSVAFTVSSSSSEADVSYI